MTPDTFFSVLLGAPLCVGIMALAIWTVVALQNWILGAKHRNDKDRLERASYRRPWQFSLRSLFVLTTACAVVCSLLKTLPPLVLAFGLYIGGVFLVMVLIIGSLTAIVGGVTALIEWLMAHPAKASPPQDDDERDADPGMSKVR